MGNGIFQSRRAMPRTFNEVTATQDFSLCLSWYVLHRYYVYVQLRPATAAEEEPDEVQLICDVCHQITILCELIRYSVGQNDPSQSQLRNQAVNLLE